MKRWIYNGLIILFIAVFLVSGGILAKYYIESAQQGQEYSDLADIMANAPTTPRPVVTDDPTAPVVTEPTAPAFVEVEDPETGEIISVLPEFAELYVMNNDIVGWIRIPGTDIDYPVMQTPDEKDYYLKRNFSKEYSAHGCIYVQETCDVFAPSDNLTIYGHRMKDRSMFAQLDNYQKQSFYRANPYIFFDTIHELHTYRIMAVFVTSSSVGGTGFSYQAFIDAATEEEFDNFVSKCKEYSLYDTGITAQYGDKLITLSTCDYSVVNGRLVIVAKRVA